MFRNLLLSLFRHQRITTTEAKAKAVRGLAEQMVTLAKRDTLHARRQVLAMMPDADVVGDLFSTIAPRFGDRNGGYTRIIKAGRRRGDAAPLVLLELVDRPETPPEKGSAKGEKREKAPQGEASAKGRRGKKERTAAASA
jgi:large subunit ribosomal protein L17